MFNYIIISLIIRYTFNIQYIYSRSPLCNCYRILPLDRYLLEYLVDICTTPYLNSHIGKVHTYVRLNQLILYLIFYVT